MRIVNLKEFLKLPPGTIYCKGTPWVFDGITIKGDSLKDDWVYLDIAWPSAHDPGEACGLMQASLDGGVSFQCEDAYGRDGCFDDDAVFMIFEKEDLRVLGTHVCKALELTSR